MVRHFGFPWSIASCALGKPKTYNMVMVKLKLNSISGTLRQLQEWGDGMTLGGTVRN